MVGNIFPPMAPGNSNVHFSSTRASALRYWKLCLPRGRLEWRQVCYLERSDRLLSRLRSILRLRTIWLWLEWESGGHSPAIFFMCKNHGPKTPDLQRIQCGLHPVEWDTRFDCNSIEKARRTSFFKHELVLKKWSGQVLLHSAEKNPAID